MTAHPQELSIWWRLYIYSLHGYFSEIVFTAIWDFVLTTNFKLMGTTSLWTMPIYGVSGLIVEKIYQIIKEDMELNLFVRGIIYVLWTYIWEFSTGFILRLFHACPWDYESYNWDFLGLICLEYAPFWFIGSMVVDQFIIPYTLQLQWKPCGKINRNTSDERDIYVKQD